jgi:hypothetical protein
MEAIQRAEHAEAMVDGGGSGFGIFVELIADIVEQSGFIHLKQSPGRMLQAPPCEMQEIISIGAQGTEGQLANALGIEEVIDPGHFVSLVVNHPVG